MDAPAVEYQLDRVVRAWDYVRVEGTFARDGRPPVAVVLACPGEGGPIQARIDGHRFTLSGLIPEHADVTLCSLEATFAGGATSRVSLSSAPRPSGPGVWPLLERMRSLVAEHPAPRVLEIGGRARSGVLHRDIYGPVAEYVGLDVLPGEGVDVVADAHEMSAALGGERFDFACSYMVWEHLAMPWKVVLELNRVLVTGGHAYVVAPQTCGMHDLPWDFFRFSDSAFRALFAAETGFEVLEVERGVPMHLFPFIGLDPIWRDAEAAAGFFAVGALVRKTGPTELSWPADASRVVSAPYPA
jgi:SAM-dependent methyltransferase